MTDDIAAELRRLYEAAEPGEWDCLIPGSDTIAIHGADGDQTHIAWIDNVQGGADDARLIVAMHEALPALLDAVEAMRGLRRYPANTVSAEVYEMRLDAALAALKRSDEG